MGWLMTRGDFLFGDEAVFGAAAPGGDQAAPAGVGTSTLAARVGARLPTFSNEQIADFLVDGYWSKRSFNLGDSGTEHKDGVLQYNVSALSAAGRNLAERALALYEAVLDVDFVRTAATSSSVVDIRFDDVGVGAFTTTTTQGPWLSSSSVNISTGWLRDYGTGVNSYSFQTYLHEVGHALGLGHAGDYNGAANFVTSTTDPDYGDDSNHYLNDSWQASVMSYFTQEENTTVDASFVFVISPTVADWIALDTLYPLRAAFAGNTVWGFNSNIATTVLADLALQAEDTAFTIVDGGGADTVDFSGYSAAQTIRLSQGAYSDIGGRTGNMSIARGTVIESAVGGDGDDRLYGNTAANGLRGGDGRDRLYGGEGNDSLFGGNAADELHGGNGRDVLAAGLGADRLLGDGGNDRLVGEASADTLSGGSGADTFVFRSMADSRPGAGDLVTGAGGIPAFEGAGATAGDLFDLTGLGNLAWGGSGRGAITLRNVSGDTFFYVNGDADAAPEFEVGIVDGGIVASDYTRADFLFL